MKNTTATFRWALLLMLLLLLATFLATGCAVVGKPPIKINYYDPVLVPSSTITEKEQIKEVEYKNDKYDISVAIISGGNIFASNIEIKNKTKKEILPGELSIALYDGRDRVELEEISKEVVANYRTKLAAGQDIKTGNSILDYSLNSFTGLVETTTPLNKDQYSAYIKTVLDHYFSYRPIYPNFTRKGILCFFNKIILEYPLIMVIKIKEETYEFKFWPAGTAPVNPDTNFPDYEF